MRRRVAESFRFPRNSRGTMFLCGPRTPKESHVTKRAAFLIVVLLALASSAFGQGVRRDDTVTVSIFGVLKPVAGATVRVCSSGSTGNPCTPLASIYSDIALTQPLANPMTADAQANYHFYAS